MATELKIKLRRFNYKAHHGLRNPYHVVMDAFGDDFGGNSAYPGSQSYVRLREYPEERDYLAASIVDGGLWIGTAHKWQTSMSRPEAHRLARFIVWDWWIRGEWCGLRSSVWKWALHRHVEQFTARLHRERVAQTIAEADAAVRAVSRSFAPPTPTDGGDQP